MGKRKRWRGCKKRVLATGGMRGELYSRIREERVMGWVERGLDWQRRVCRRSKDEGTRESKDLCDGRRESIGRKDGRL